MMQAKQVIWSAIALITLVALTGCTTVMSEEDCIAADWTVIGEQDGFAGKPLKTFDDRLKKCTQYKVPVNVLAYHEGRQRGLRQYCTPQAGYTEGKAGRRYHQVCPPALEPAFLAEYKLGYQLYELTRDYDQAVDRYERAVNELQSTRYDLRRARDRYHENPLSDEEREALRLDMDNYRREIKRLEYDLPLLESNIDRARRELDDYRAWLSRQNPNYL